jgi:hypothetical protein
MNGRTICATFVQIRKCDRSIQAPRASQQRSSRRAQPRALLVNFNPADQSASLRRSNRAGNKRVIIAVSRGGFYGAGSPAAGEYVETYLRWVFGFIGVKNLEFISADGVSVGPEHREKALAGALQAATNVAAA